MVLTYCKKIIQKGYLIKEIHTDIGFLQVTNNLQRAVNYKVRVLRKVMDNVHTLQATHREQKGLFLHKFDNKGRQKLATLITSFITMT